MGSPAGAGGTGQGSSVFLPQFQPQAGAGFLGELAPLAQIASGGGTGSSSTLRATTRPATPPS